MSHNVKVTIEVVQYLRASGWTKRELDASSHGDAQRWANRNKRSAEYREIKIVCLDSSGHTAHYTIKTRFPRPPRQPSQDWLASLEIAS